MRSHPPQRLVPFTACALPYRLALTICLTLVLGALIPPLTVTELYIAWAALAIILALWPSTTTPRQETREE